MRILPAALMTVVSAVFTLAAESAEEEDVRQRMRRDAYPHSSLNLPEQLPEELRIKVVLGGQDVNLVLERHSIRASTFRVAFRQKDGSFVDVVAPPPSTYLGYVVEEPERVALACLTSAGLKVKANGGGKYDLVVPLESVLEAARRSQKPAEIRPADNGKAASDPRTPCPEFRSVTIGWDIDFRFFANRNQDVDRCLADVELFCADLDMTYARDALTRHLCGTILIGYEGEPTSRFDHENRWLSYDRKVIPHHAACMIAEGGGGSGGIAQVNQMGGWIPYASSWFQDYTCFKHEVGHIWGARDHEDPWPWNAHAMRGDLDLLAQNLHALVLQKRAAIQAPAADPYPTPVRPYACPDSVEMTAGTGPIKIDVLANDHDANGDTIHIAAFDVRSAEGGMIELSAGTGGGRDQLIFTPSATKDPPYSDKFWYTLQDSTGRSHRTGVAVHVRTKE